MTGKRYTELGGFFHKGSVSTGTLRTQDLLRSFADEYERLLPFNSASLVFKAREAAKALDIDVPIQEQADEVLEQLVDTLNEIASRFGCRFGALEGDGADFGFWSVEEDCVE